MSNIQDNPFISYKFEPNYFQNYKFDYFCFEKYDGIKPFIGDKYPTFEYDGVIYQDEKLLMEIKIHTILIKEEAIWLVESKKDGILYKPVFNDTNSNSYKIYNSWLNTIYSWINPSDNTMYNDKNSELTDYYIQRKVYLEKDPETAHLKFWAGKLHYIEWLGGPKPPPTCACCGNTRVEKPTEDEFINSTVTTITIKQQNYEINKYSETLIIKLLNGNQIKTELSYSNNKLNLSWDNWVCPGYFSFSTSYYLKFFIGQFFKEKTHRSKNRYYYPKWVTDDTIWYVPGEGVESGKDYFPELNPNHESEQNIRGYGKSTGYTDLVTNAVNLSSNTYLKELIELVIEINKELSNLFPGDIKGDLTKTEFCEDSNNKDYSKMIKYSGLIDLDTIRNNYINYFESLKPDSAINKLVEKLKIFNKNLIPEIDGYLNTDYNETEQVENLIKKYSLPVINSSDIIFYKDIYGTTGYWLFKTVVNSQLVKYNKEVKINFTEDELNYMDTLNEEARKEYYTELRDKNKIKLDNELEVVKNLFVDIAKKTWPNRNIIIYDNVNREHNNKNLKNLVDCEILTWSNKD